MVTILAVDAMNDGEIEAGVTAFVPDIILAFHAFYCGEIACRQARRLTIPCIVTITGSDINEPHFREHRRMQTAMEMADAVVCFDEGVATLVNRYFQHCRGRLVLIPQGVDSLTVSTPSNIVIPDDAFVLLLPAALRQVKNIEFPLRALAPIAGQNSKIMLVIAGGVIESEYADMIRDMVTAAPFALWLGEVPHDRMGTLYARADIVLNCSRYEGMPNSLLEAMALARPVVAANIAGNRSLIRDKETGWLYSGATELAALVQALVNSPVERAAVGQRAKEYVLSFFSPQKEAARYIELFTSLGTVLAPMNFQERMV
jgi:glycosyltransferase involved in cell wall biosynthesis